jgi:RNA recognition motif-containing protein
MSLGIASSDGPSRISANVASHHQEGRDGDNQLNKKLYVGNLPFSATEADIRELFEPHGSIESVNVITDRETGRPRGFAFVEMNDAESASKAMQALDGRDLSGRNLKVNEANERPARSGGGYGGSRGRY